MYIVLDNRSRFQVSRLGRIGNGRQPASLGQALHTPSQRAVSLLDNRRRVRLLRNCFFSDLFHCLFHHVSGKGFQFFGLIRVQILNSHRSKTARALAASPWRRNHPRACGMKEERKEKKRKSRSRHGQQRSEKEQLEERTQCCFLVPRMVRDNLSRNVLAPRPTKMDVLHVSFVLAKSKMFVQWNILSLRCVFRGSTFYGIAFCERRTKWVYVACTKTNSALFDTLLDLSDH